MERKNIITAPQLFGLLLLCSIIVGITYNLPMAKSDNIWDHIVSAAVALIVDFVLIFPNHKLHKMNPDMSIADNCSAAFKRFGPILLLVYGVYYLFCGCYTLSLFNIFVRDVVNPDISLFMLTLFVVLAASYAACKGIEGLARAGTIILFIIGVSVVFIIITLIPQLDVMNYSPLLYDGPNNTLNGVIYIVSLSFYIPLAAMIMPFVKGDVKKTLIGTNCVIFFIMVMAIAVVVGALGDYLKTQSFPFYTATSVAEIGVFRRLDALYLGVFTMGLFMTTALFFFSFFLVMKKLFGGRKSKLIITLGDVLLLVISLVLTTFKEVSYLFYNMYFVLTFTLVTAFIIPVVVLLRQKIKPVGRRAK